MGGGRRARCECSFSWIPLGLCLSPDCHGVLAVVLCATSHCFLRVFPQLLCLFMHWLIICLPYLNINPKKAETVHFNISRLAQYWLIVGAQ